MICEGLKNIINQHENLEVAGEANNRGELFHLIEKEAPDLLTIDTHSECFFNVDDLTVIHQQYPKLKILVVAFGKNRTQTIQTIEKGVTGYLYHHCSSSEISEALDACSKGQRFFCEDVLDLILGENRPSNPSNEAITEKCKALELTAREIEIIKLISRQFNNKEIAEKLAISPHTVLTHRKNIMQKLNTRNSAGIALFAVENGLIKDLY